MAGRIPEDFINEVRNNVNIVDVISQYVSLEKKGKDYIGLCPFHQEKTPSFTVNEQKQFFKCFGCGRGGNVFKFFMYKNLTFPESVAKVAQFAHMEMPDSYGNSGEYSDPLFKIYEAALSFYDHVLLATKVGERGLAYARKRMLNDALIKHFKIGYAPPKNNLLWTFLHDKGFKDEDLRASGLFLESKQSGQLFDRFRDRLMFPLATENGEVVGFSGRRVSNDKQEAKYMNSPETKIFTKAKLLFHFSEARKAARAEKHLTLYEGYMDVIAAYKAGVKSGIASMGTSLTDQQIYLIRRITPNIIINYDGDAPGVHAEERAARMFADAGGFHLGIVVLPENLDPDEYVRKYGAEKYRHEIEGALTPTAFFLKRLTKKYNLHNDRERLAYLADAIKEIAKLPNPVERDLYVKKLAQSQNVSQNSLKANLIRQIRQNRRTRRHRGQSPIDLKTPVDRSIPGPNLKKEDHPIQKRLLYLFIHAEEARTFLLSKHFLFPNSDYAQLAELWLQFQETHDQPTVNSFLDFIPDRLQSIIVNAEMADMPQDYSNRELKEDLYLLHLHQIDHQLNHLQQKVDSAAGKADQQEVLKITQQILRLKRAQGQKEAF